KGQKVLLQNVDVVKMDYVRRSTADRNLLRKEFDNGVRKKFLKDIANNPEVVKRLDAFDRSVLAKGVVPDGYQVHHKLPLDDSGNNNFDNLVLISTRPEHAAFTTTQKHITKNLTPTGTNIVLWPKPQGIIYP
ncbi:HNH endonuclease signature motif containing protein, partial [Yersinia pseudotuberculosis]